MGGGVLVAPPPSYGVRIKNDFFKGHLPYQGGGVNFFQTKRKNY